MEIQLDGTMPEVLPLPLFASSVIGSAENRGEHFDLVIGLNEVLVTKLKMLSLNTADTDLQANTSDLERFGKGSYEEWYAKNRVPFALVEKKSGALAALAWFGPKPIGRKSLKHLSAEELTREHSVESGDWHTVTFRSYPPFRGTGVMKEFMRAVTNVYTKHFPEAKLWAGISRQNTASVALCQRLGYSIDESVSDPTWVAMVRS